MCAEHTKQLSLRSVINSQNKNSDDKIGTQSSGITYMSACHRVV
jgi:hypothetical protein